MSHTPGPWTLGVARKHVAFVNAGRHTICKCDSDGLQIDEKANATLIAAAPDMLAAIEFALDDDNDWQHVRDELRKARAKAKGR